MLKRLMSAVTAQTSQAVTFLATDGWPKVVVKAWRREHPLLVKSVTFAMIWGRSLIPRSRDSG